MNNYETSIANKSINNFLFNLKISLVFEMLYKLVVWFIFVPINYYILNRFLNKMGVDNITNKQIIKFGLSYQGIFYMAIVLIIAFIAVFIEISVLTYISKKSHDKKRASIIEGIVSSIKLLKKLTNVYLVGIIAISTIVGPLAGVGLYTALIRSLSIPDYVKYQLSKHSGWQLMLAIGVILFVIIFVRWILVISSLVIEDVSLKVAFKHSHALYRRNHMKIFGYIFCWVIVNYGLKIFLLGGCVGAGLFFITLTEGSLMIQEIISNSSLIVFFIGYVIISIISLPIFFSFLVEIYYKYKFYHVKERRFSAQEYIESKKCFSLVKKYRERWMAVVLVVFVFITGSRGMSIVFNKVVDKEVQITAHRGSSLKAPENSISAVVEAIIEGSDYVEIDVMTTLDDYVVLFHDNTLRRFTGSNKSIKKLTLDEVQQVDIGSKFSDKYKGETIPALEEVLQLSKDNIKLNIELKPRKKKDKLAELVANMVTEYGLEDQVKISSQSYESLLKVKEINPLIDVGLIVTFGIGDFSKMNVDFISVEYEMAKEELIYTMHALDKEVHVWTINDKKKAENVIKLGVDNIITDNVGMVQRTQISLQESDDVNYLTRFLDGITSIMKHVKI